MEEGDESCNVVGGSGDGGHFMVGCSNERLNYSHLLVKRRGETWGRVSVNDLRISDEQLQEGDCTAAAALCRASQCNTNNNSLRSFSSRL